MGAAPIDLSGGLQPKGVDLSAGLQPKQPQKGFLGSFADSSGLTALAHPIDTIMGLPHAIAEQVKDSYQGVKQGVADYQKNGMDLQTRRDFGYAVPVLGPALKTAQSQYEQGDKGGFLGTLLGTAAGFAAPEAVGEVGKAAKGVAPGVLDAVGDAAQSQAGKVINRATGTLKSDFKRGANPGRGYLAQGGGMATGMGDLADKAEEVKAATGQKIRDAYVAADQSGTQIPAQVVVDALQKPMQKVYQSGFLPSALKSSIETHAQDLVPVLDEGIKRGYFTPSQVFDLKRNIADFTNWGDQTQKTLNGVKQQQTGALSGLLHDTVPDLAPLDQGYQDLIKMASRARERADTGSQPLTSHLYSVGSMAVAGALGGGEHGGIGALVGAGAAKALRSVPARTGIAEGLYKGGGALSDLADTLRAKEAQPANVGVAAGSGLDSSGQNANQGVGNPVPNQLNPPQKWLDLGASKLTQHIKGLPSPKVTAADIDALKSTPQGKQILASASGLLPGSKAMTALAAQIIAQAGASSQKDKQ